MAFVNHIFSRVNRIFNQKNKVYIKERNKPIIRNACLIEAGQGKNINGNMFAIMRELSCNDAFQGYTLYVVTTEEREDEGVELLRTYNISANPVIRNSPKYEMLLARCEFLFTDNTFPPYFHKRNDQRYLNTWHGTPLKQLGKSNISNSLYSLANVQKNMLAADYLLFPNELTKDCFFDDYMLRQVFSHHYVMCDYPRNDTLTNQDIRIRVRESEGLGDKRVIAYMPTWRGASRKADIDAQIKQVERLLSSLDNQLSDNTFFYVNLHFLLSDTLDYECYSRIRQFPKQYETYDFLSACDVLITDYSSVFFDFAVTGKKIILYPYDKEEYLETVGTYLPYDELPFPIVTTPETLLEEAEREEYDPYPAFMNEYCAYHNGHSTRDLLETICLGIDTVKLHNNADATSINIRFQDDFSDIVASETVAEEIRKSWPENGMLFFTGRSSAKNLEFLESLPENIRYLGVTVGTNTTPYQHIVYALAKRNPIFVHLFSRTLKTFFASEFDRHFPGVIPSSILAYTPNGEYILSILGSAKCTKTGQVRKYALRQLERQKAKEGLFNLAGFVPIHTLDLPTGVYSEEAKQRYFNYSTRCRLLTHSCKNTQTEVRLEGMAEVYVPEFVPTKSLALTLEDGRTIGTFTELYRHTNRRLLHYTLSYPLTEIHSLAVNNVIYFSYTPENGYGFRVDIGYNIMDRSRSHLRHPPLVIDKSSGSSLYFRQGAKNTLQISARKTNPLDDPRNQKRLNIAYALAHLWPLRRSIVLYEKMSSRYEESASVVFEYLIDHGYKSVYYILDENYSHKDIIAPKYRKHIVARNTFKHYWLFFTARTFIGTEMLSHCLELHTNSLPVSKRYRDPTINYVFLQHGVMYMVSLNSESRRFFKQRKSTKGKYRVVTSSELEKNHFVELGKYDEESLYVCGLPKFDRNIWNEDANRIVIMLTWRPWEANAARVDFQNTEYYRFIESIVNSIPKDVHDNITVLMHPLFQECIGDTDCSILKYINTTEAYDTVLQHTKLLITDYSSIAYDAYYRGANVIFCWQDKDSCMKHYGPSTTLMIDEKTAFGDVCFTPDEIRASVLRNYSSNHNPDYDSRFSRIVEFHDGQNTERLIQLMKKDGII